MPEQIPEAKTTGDEHRENVWGLRTARRRPRVDDLHVDRCQLADFDADSASPQTKRCALGPARSDWSSGSIWFVEWQVVW